MTVFFYPKNGTSLSNRIVRKCFLFFVKLRCMFCWIESRGTRTIDNCTSPETTKTQPKCLDKTCLSLSHRLFSMHELDSLVISAPLNLQYSFTVILVIIISMNKTKTVTMSCIFRKKFHFAQKDPLNTWASFH